MYKFILLAIGAMMFYSCATTYRGVTPETSTHYTEQEADSINYGYDHSLFDVQAKKRYSKKARRKNLGMVAFKIENNATDTLLLIRDVKFFHGTKLVVPVTSKEAHRQIKQGELSHFGWYLLALPIPKVIDLVGPFTQLPIALITGNFNLFMAGAANRKFKENLQRDNILYRKIPPGEISYGLICFPEQIVSEITLQRVKR